MSTPREITHHVDDYIEMTVDIEDCPLAELPLTEIFNVDNMKINDDYLTTLRGYIEQQLEDTSWLDDRSTSPLFDAGFSTFTRKANGDIVSLRKPALQRLIEQTLRHRETNDIPVSIPIFIRFMVLDGTLPVRSGMTATIPSVVGGTTTTARVNRRGNEERDIESAGEMSNIVDSPVLVDDGRGNLDISDDVAEESPLDPTQTTPRTRISFRGIPVNVLPTTRDRQDDTSRSHPGIGTDYNPRHSRERLNFNDDVGGGTPRTQYTQHSNRTHTSSHADLTYGAETYRDYMQQFMSTEVKYKDFRKTTIHKFDSSKQDSFIHWYKLFCATCLQWGIWCPPYESVMEDEIHGCWWSLLPASVRTQDAFMSSLLYFALSTESVFPVGSREFGAVQGCPPNAGYHAIYAILRLHHPRLQTVVNTVTEIPRQRRSEIFSSYLRRLQDFLA